MKPEAIIFDFDGTLADSMWVWDDVDRAFLARRDIPFDEEYAETIAVLGFEGGADYVIDFFGLDEKPEDIIEEWKETAAEAYATSVMLKPYAIDYLHRLKRLGLPLAIATSLQRSLLEPALKNNEIFGFFDAVVVCDELGCKGKSTPAVYLEAARRLETAPELCVVFEDVVTAAHSAKKGGMYVVGVYDEHKQQKSDELEEICDRFIRGYDEIFEEDFEDMFQLKDGNSAQR